MRAGASGCSERRGRRYRRCNVLLVRVELGWVGLGWVVTEGVRDALDAERKVKHGRLHTRYDLASVVVQAVADVGHGKSSLGF